MAKLRGHVFWYGSERPDSFGQALSAVLLGSIAARWTILGQTGPVKIRASAKVPDAIDSAWNAGFIAASAKTSVADHEALIVYYPSPLSAQYVPYDGLSAKSPNLNRNEEALFLSLQSINSYVVGRKLSQFPNLMRAERILVSESSDAVQDLASIADSLLSIPTASGFRWLAVIDVTPRLLPDIVSLSLIGSADPIADRLDRFMFAPSFLTIGSKTTLSEYRSDMSRSFPGLRYSYREVGNSAYMLLKSANQLNDVYLPKWHQTRR